MRPSLLVSLYALLLLSASIPAFAQDDETPESPQVKLLKSGRVPEARLGSFVDQIGQRGSAADLAYLFGRTVTSGGFPEPVRQRALEVLAEAASTRKVRPSGQLDGLVSMIAAKDVQPAIRLAAVRLAGLWKFEKASPALAQIVEVPGSASPLLSATLESLAEIDGASNKALIAGLTRQGRPAEVRALAVAALARLDLEAASQAAADVLRHAEKGQDFAPMLAPFLSLKDGIDKLTTAIARADIPPDSAKLALRAVYALGRSDAGLIEALSKAAKITADVKPPDKAEMDRLIAEVNSQGNPARGEAVFRRPDLNCLKCHAVAGAAGGVGPELSSVGASSPVDYLVNSIIVPDQAIKEEFVTKVIQTTDGRIYHGIVADKDERRLVLREANGERRTIPADEIEDQKDGGSLMPKGLVNLLTRAEFIDLLKFLSELGKPGPYAFHTTPTLQRWRVLKPVPASLTKGVPDAETFRADVLGADPSRWLPAYASVPGFLDLGELYQEVGGPLLYLKGEVNVTAGGAVEFRLNNRAGVDAWIDDRPIETPGSTLTAELTPGVHVLTLRVDTTVRMGLPLKVEVVKPEGAATEFTVVGGR
jgi:putative heme-binding domain-containing protein